MKAGRPQTPIGALRESYISRFGLTLRYPIRDLTAALLDQLEACRDDEARRLILGVSQ